MRYDKDLKSFQIAEVVFGSTRVFCDRFIDPSSRTVIGWCRRREAENRILPRASWPPGLAQIAQKAADDRLLVGFEAG